MNTFEGESRIGYFGQGIFLAVIVEPRPNGLLVCPMKRVKFGDGKSRSNARQEARHP